MTTRPFAYSPAWPHGPLRPAFTDTFFVVGTNQTRHDGVDYQTSRTMLVVRDGDGLTLVNTVRLDDATLRELDALGRVRHVIRLGAFHGRDDPFYCDRYGAALWALPGVEHADGRPTTDELKPDGPLPIKGARLVALPSSRFPEAMLLLARDGGILVTCDAIQNWVEVDPFFSRECGERFLREGLIAPANVPSTWLRACAPDAADFRAICALPFRHLVSAHGEPLRDDARERITARVEATFPR